MKQEAQRRGVAEPAAEAPLEQRLSFLVHAIHARIGAIGNRHFRAHDLNQYSARILVLLLEHEELRTGELNRPGFQGGWLI